MIIPTEPIGSIPRPIELIKALAATDGTDPALSRFMMRPFATPSSDSRPPARL